MLCSSREKNRGARTIKFKSIVMDFTLHEIAKLCSGQLLSGHTYSVYSKIIIDSRKVIDPEGSIFIALKGPTFDGHDFIGQCIEKGIKSFIVSKNIEGYPEDINILKVRDTLHALHQISASHRSKFTYPVLGITGSNGKTILKEWINQTLYEDFEIVRSPKSYNSQVGVPLSILLMEESKNLGVFEVGMSKPGEIDNLVEIVRPDIGVFTNIGNAHSENFDSLEAKVREKAKLFKYCKTIIYCNDDKLISTELSNYSLMSHFTWSLTNSGTVNFLKLDDSNGTHFKAQLPGSEFDFYVPFTDNASIQNCLHLVTFLIHMNLPNATIASRVKELKKVGMRLETVEGINNSLLINDVYNSDLTSLGVALDMLSHEPNFSKKHLVLSEMKHTGLSDSQMINNVRSMIKNIDLNSIHYVGHSVAESRPTFNGTATHYYENTQDFIDKLNIEDFSNSVVLIKGERKFEFEKITHFLQKKTHDTVLEINLRALKENLNYYRSQVNPGVKIAVMVKAFSYGSGLHEIAASLEKNNINYLAVAYADEGIALRERKINLPIMVMNPENASAEDFDRYDLEPVVYNFGLLDRFLGQGSPIIPIHIKFDTGMHRLGFGVSDLQSVLSKCVDHKNQIASVLTHLAASDDYNHDDFTQSQLQKFESIVKECSRSLGNHLLFHALNSAGISRFPNYQFDMVRLGIGLYGYSLNEDDLKYLQPVLSLKSVISQIKEVHEGETVGYSRAFHAAENMTIGVIPVGYADGILRSFGNGNGTVFIEGKKCKTVGNICMDMCMIDITNMGFTEGIEVEFFGENKSIKDTADEMGTIAYEVLANISQRVKRRFFSD